VVKLFPIFTLQLLIMIRFLLFSLLLFAIKLNLNAQQPRLKISLNDSSWTFIKKDIPTASEVVFNDDSWLAVTIPHDWNGGIDGVNNDVFTGPDMYKGIGWYRSSFKLNNNFTGKRILLTFEAVSLQADVWLNGNYLGNHKGGYTSFCFDVTDFVVFNQENILAVKASNANDPGIAPWMKEPYGEYPNSSDYAFYGGIYRDVLLTVTNPVQILSEKHTTSNISASSANVNITTTIKNHGASNATVTLISEIVDSANQVINFKSKEYTIDGSGEMAITSQIPVSNPKLWSPSTPYLYSMKTTLKIGQTEVDQTRSTLGIRWFTLKNNQPFVLNGQKLFLEGINRHQDRAGFGYALSNHQHKEDMAVIKSLGFNFMRHAHYPCDEAVLDACDSLGICVWLEIPVSTCISPDTAFLINARSQMKEMIEEHFNHPSVIVWGMGNESDQSSAATEKYTNTFFTELNKVAHAADSTRPTTGCNFRLASNQAIPDIYSPQDWDGWYGGNYTTYTPTKMIGEYGADSHIPSHNETFKSNATTEPWTQEYACKLHEYKASVGEARKNLFPAHLVWVAFDFASPRRDRSTNPIPFMNQKGVISHDRKVLKDVAYFYRSYNTSGKESPMVYIVSETWKDRIKKPGRYNIWAYSNCDSVVLYNGFNKNYLGAKTRSSGPSPNRDTRFQWSSTSIKDSILVALGFVDGIQVASDTLIYNSFKPTVTSADQFVDDATSDLSAYPNPVTDIVNISFYLPSHAKVSLSITDISGKLIENIVDAGFQTGPHVIEYQTAKLQRGIYFCQLKYEGFNRTIKLLKE
jgi:beta-galactosidase